MSADALPPGPRLPGVAQAALFGLRYPQLSASCRERFGSTFTLRPGSMGPIVLTADRDAIGRLFTGDPSRRAHGNDATRPLIGERSVLLLEPAEHLARRKLLLPSFHGERVRGYAELMSDLIAREVRRWRPGEEVATLPVAQDLTIEVIMQAVLGVADEPSRDRLRRVIDDTLFYPMGAARLRRVARRSTRSASRPRWLREATAFVSALPTPAVLTYFSFLKRRSRRNPLTSRWWHHRDALMTILDEQVALVRADHGRRERSDILAMLAAARDEEGAGLTDDDLRDDLLALIGAGHETTAAAIAWGSVLLAHSPEVQRQAGQAAREGDDRYIETLVKEVLRIRPPLPIAAGRILDEPFEAGGHEIPPGTLIMVDAWGVHHDPDLYPDPERFDPDRFDGSDPEPYAWLPFGGGAHRCIGAALAQLEIQIALRTILTGAWLEPADADLPPPARRAVTLVPHGGGRVVIGRALD